MALLLLACTLQTGKLIVGVSYVVPEYNAGAKYRTPESFASMVAAELAKQLDVTLVTEKYRQQLLAQQ